MSLHYFDDFSDFLDGLTWSVSFNETYIKLMEKVSQDYSLSISATEYMLTISGRIANISTVNHLTDQPIMTNKLKTSMEGLGIIADQGATVMLSNEGNDIASINGQILSNKIIDTLVIFSKAGFEINNVSINNIKTLVIITATFRDLLNPDGSIDLNKEKIIADKLGDGKVKIEGKLEGLQSNIQIYSKWYDCKAEIKVKDLKLFLYTSLTDNISMHQCIYRDGDKEFYLPELAKYDLPDLKFKGNLKISAPKSISKVNKIEVLATSAEQRDGNIGLEFKALVSNENTSITATRNLVIKTDQFENNTVLGTFVGGHVTFDLQSGINLRGSITANSGFWLLSLYFEMFSGLLQVNGRSILKLEDYYRQHKDTTFITTYLIIENQVGERLSGSIELLSGNLAVNKDALLRTQTGLFVKRENALIDKEPKIIQGNSNEVRTHDPHHWPCNAHGRAFYDIFKGTGASLLKIEHDLFVDVGYIYIHISSIDIGGTAEFIHKDQSKSPELRVECKPKKLYVEGIYFSGHETSIYGPTRIAAILQQAGFKKLPNIGYSGAYSSSYTEVYEIIPSTIIAREGFFGSFKGVSVGCAEGSIQFNQVEAGRYANAITGGNLATAIASESANALVVAQGGIPRVATQDPDRFEDIKDQLLIPNLSNLNKDNYIVNNNPQLVAPTGATEANDDYQYLFTGKYPRLFSCEVDITYILKALNISPGQAGKIFCDSDCQVGLIKSAAYEKLGISIEQVSPNIRQHLIQQLELNDGNEISTQGKDCLITGKLLSNAVTMYKKLNLKVGFPPSEEQMKAVDIPFIWPIYSIHENNQYLTPVLVLSPGSFKNSPGWYGAALVAGGHSNMQIDTLIDAGGAIMVNGGQIIGKNALVLGRFITTGPNQLKVQFDNAAFVSQIDHMTGGNGITYQRLSYAGIEVQDKILYLVVNNDLLMQGVTLKGDILAEVGKNAYIMTGKQITAAQTHFKNGYSIVGSVTNILNTIDGSLYIASDQKLIAEGIVAMPESTINFKSTHDEVQVSATADEGYSKTVTKAKKLLKTITKTNIIHNIKYAGNIFGVPEEPIKEFVAVAHGNTILAAAKVYTQSLYLEAGKDNEEKKNLIITSLQNIHYEDTKTTSIGFNVKFSNNKLTYLESTTREETYGSITQEQSVIVVYGEGQASLVSNGKIYMLASTMEKQTGKVHYHAPEGIYLQELDNEELHIVMVEDWRKGWGFKASKEELSVKEGIFFHSHWEKTTTKIPTCSGIKSELIAFDTKYLYTKGAMLQYKDLYFRGLDWIDEPALAQFMKSIKTQDGFVGVKLGIKQNLSRAIEDTKKLGESNLKDGSGAINAISGVDQAVASWLKAYAQPVEGGIYVTISFSGSESRIEKIVPVVSEFHSIGHTDFIGNKLWFKGTQFKGITMYIEAEELQAVFATSSFEYKYGDYEVALDIPLTGGVPILNIGGKVSQTSAQKTYLFSISMAEGLEFKIRGDTTLDGAKIEAKSIKMDFGSLLLRSAQDIATYKTFGGRLGLNIVSKIEEVINSLGAEYQRGDSKLISELTRIIGRESVEIIVAGMLKMVGSKIANEGFDKQGNPTDKGKLYIKAKELIAETVHGYDKGILLGASAKLMPNGYMEQYSVDFGLTENVQKVMSVIGNGNRQFDKTTGGCSSDISNQIYASKNQINAMHVSYTEADFNKIHERTKDSTILERAVQPIKEMGETLSTAAGAVKGFFSKFAFGEESDPGVSDDENSKHEAFDEYERETAECSNDKLVHLASLSDDIAIGDGKNARQKLIEMLIQVEEYRQDLYVDSEGVPTIGVGCALIVKNKKSWVVAHSQDELRDIGIDLPNDLYEKIVKLAKDKTDKKSVSDHEKFIENYGFTIGNEQIEKVFNFKIAETEGRVLKGFNKQDWKKLTANEQNAIISAVYQGASASVIYKEYKSGGSESVFNHLYHRNDKVDDYKLKGQTARARAEANFFKFGSPCLEGYHCVTSEDNKGLGVLAKKYGTTVKELRRLNPEVQDDIFKLQSIKLPEESLNKKEGTCNNEGRCSA